MQGGREGAGGTKKEKMKHQTSSHSIVRVFFVSAARPFTSPTPTTTHGRRARSPPPTAAMTSPSKRRELDITKLLLSDHDVELVDDNISEFYITFHGPKDSEREREKRREAGAARASRGA